MLRISLLQGIVGGTYDRYLEGEDAVSKPEDQLFIPEDVSVLPTILAACSHHNSQHHAVQSRAHIN